MAVRGNCFFRLKFRLNEILSDLEFVRTRVLPGSPVDELPSVAVVIMSKRTEPCIANHGQGPSATIQRYLNELLKLRALN